MFIPENEMGVIYLFAQQQELFNYKLVKIQSQYPDAILEVRGSTYKVEFE